MKKFKVEVEWSGYSRGIATYLVEAKSEEDAKEYYYEGERVYHETIRDDTEGTALSAMEFDV